MGLFRRKKIEEFSILPKDDEPIDTMPDGTRQEDSASRSSSSPKGSIFHGKALPDHVGRNTMDRIS